MSTISLDSAIKRRGWIKEGLLQETANSFWHPFTSMGDSSIIKQANDARQDAGHNVVFQYRGNHTVTPIEGRDTAFGKGKDKKVFSSKIEIRRFRFPIDNGDVFDGVDINDLTLSQHSDSRSLLADGFSRWKDQMYFDCGQGIIDSFTSSHEVDLGTTFGYDELLDLAESTRTGKFGTKYRRPLKPYRTENGEDCYFIVLDAYSATMLRKDSDFKTVIQHADVRGNNNRLIKGVFGKINNLYLVEAPTHSGSVLNDATGTTMQFRDVEVEIAGLRRKDANDVWTGQKGYVTTGAQYSYNLLLGANAFQTAFGRMPDYKFQQSMDFGIKSESALEVWMNTQKTKLTNETGEDYVAAKVSDMDYGVVTIKLKTQS